MLFFLRVATIKWDKQNKSRQNHSNQRLILRFHMSSTGGEPVLCLQKGILSPSCLPAFGKVYFHSLYRSISHYERDFSFASERDSRFFDKTILPHFSPYVNHVKLFHLVVFDLRSVRGPGLPPCPDALLRVGVMIGLYSASIGVLMGWLGQCGISDFCRITFEAIEVVLMC